MPAAIPLAVAGVGAVGGFANAKVQSNAAKRAAAAQERSTNQALAYQKEQDAYIRSRYEKEDAREDEARAAYRQYLAANGRGPAPSAATSVTPSSMNPLAVAAGQGVMQPGYSAKPAQPTIRDMAPGASPMAPVEPGPPPMTPSAQSADVRTMPTIVDTNRWNEWEPYLRQNQPA